MSDRFYQGKNCGIWQNFGEKSECAVEQQKGYGFYSAM